LTARIVLTSMKAIALLATLALAGAALCQLTPFELGAGYGQTNSYTRSTGGQAKIAGMEFSVSQAILRLPFVGEARIGLSGLFDNDEGNVFRLFGHYRSPSAGPNGLYGVIGVFYARAESKGNSFNDFNGSGLEYGAGLPLGSFFPGLPSVAIEWVNHQSSRAQLRGWSLELKIRL
jgi:hypothetical protein